MIKYVLIAAAAFAFTTSAVAQGNPYSNQSPNNPYATDAPRIYDSQGNYRGRLSTNPYEADSTSNPYGRYGSPYSPDSINNPYATGSSPKQPRTR